MFDDITPQPNNSTTPVNTNSEKLIPTPESIQTPPPNIPIGQPALEDILAEVDKTPVVDNYQPVDISGAGGMQSAGANIPGLMNETGSQASGSGKKILIIFLVILLAVGSAGAVYFYFLRQPVVIPAPVENDNTPTENLPTDNTGDAINNVNTNINANLNTNTNLSTNINANTNVNIIQPPLDTDGDGLTDAQELELQTNPRLADSDGDGLTDKDEINIYKTNPINGDTDGDGYLDGVEIKNGFDPLGPGKLIDKIDLPKI